MKNQLFDERGESNASCNLSAAAKLIVGDLIFVFCI
jgi:hypothetical protein